MNTYSKVCFESDKTHEVGRRIVLVLERLGGRHMFDGVDMVDGTWSKYYFIDYRGYIDGQNLLPHGYTLANLEDYEKPVGEKPQDEILNSLSELIRSLSRIINKYPECAIDADKSRLDKAKAILGKNSNIQPNEIPNPSES